LADASDMTPVFHPERGALFDLSTRAKLRITGADRLRFLNGQVSNDVRKATATSAIHAAVLNAKGKMNADIFISADVDSLLLDADPELREALPARLDRYIIADDVQIQDVSGQFALFHVTGDTAPALGDKVRIVRADRFACNGWDIWSERTERERLFEQLSAAFIFCSDDAAEVFRIERGIPRWGKELTDEIIPIEANLEPSSIDYLKGCYIGQEVISRMKRSGQTNKRLCGLVSLSGEPLQPQMRLTTGEDRKEIGWIASAARSARLQKQIALGYVKRGFNVSGTRLEAIAPGDGSSGVRRDNVSIEIAALPFV
jgi:tRNA-modifying protein YgfZ